MGRAEQRAGMSQQTRLRLVEGDVDTLEEGQERLVEALDALRKVMVGILVAVTTAAIMLAVNVVVIGGRS